MSQSVVGTTANGTTARGDKLLRWAGIYYCLLGLVVLLLDVISGRLRSDVWWDVPLWYGLVMAPLGAAGVALSLTATWSRPSTLLRRVGSVVLVLMFTAATLVSGTLAYAYLSGRS